MVLIVDLVTSVAFYNVVAVMTADDLLPVLVYLVITSDIPNWLVFRLICLYLL